MTIEKQTHYGESISVNTETEPLRKQECMCLQCVRINSDPTINCPYAQAFYELCKKGNIALMVTRCRDFIKV